jgi:hypothetical protein
MSFKRKEVDQTLSDYQDKFGSAFARPIVAAKQGENFLPSSTIIKRTGGELEEVSHYVGNE